MTILIKEVEDLLRLKYAPKSEPLVIEFLPQYYEVPEIQLPRTNHLVMVKGNGAHIKFIGKSEGFTSMPDSQGQALNEFMATRYLIENFSKIEGGDYGVYIGGTFNTVLRNIEFVGQREAAVNLRFALMSRLENILVTNCFKDGIRIMDGDWRGATVSNSQSNHTVLDQCRVYARQNSEYSYVFEQNSGISLLNSISEGHPNKGAVVYKVSKGNPVVKHFNIKNFHIEQAPTDFGISILAPAATSNIFDQIYISSKINSPVIHNILNSPMDLTNIGWWDRKYKIYCTHRAPRIYIDRCHYILNKQSFETDHPAGIFFPYITVENQIRA
jgi:hypothetical protein